MDAGGVVNDQILTLAQAAEVVPLSESMLYRLAQRGEAPFTKRGGKWMTVHSDLIAWVRSGPRGCRTSESADPMPTPRRGSRLRDQVKADVIQLRRAS